jgi:glutaredoxin 3
LLPSVCRPALESAICYAVCDNGGWTAAAKPTAGPAWPSWRGGLAALEPIANIRDNKDKQMPEIEIYTQPWCPYCERAIYILTQKGVPFREIDAPGGSAARREARDRAGGRTSVPQIFIDGQHIGGCDDMVALDRAGKLDTLLGLT